ncbi:YafY family protein [Arthrobacter flavus]|uniref:YafY family protein n=1 Tax=Arthrobacter flavus TaxID=95172 RepID=A0ABW4Q9T3_9MICC
MWDTSERLLKLLSLLQRQQEWSSNSLAEELGVTARTITRDISRLRSLGYPVTTRKGHGGGYTLQNGAVLPPIMFEAKEAAAVLLALEDYATTAGTSAHARTALEKLQRVMPSRVQAATKALASHTTTIDLGSPIGVDTPDTDVTTLLLLSRCCRDGRQLNCTYRHYSGKSRSRVLEPLHLVRAMGRWYLLAYCTDDQDWAVFRADRITDAKLSPHSAQARQPPATDLDEYVSQAIAKGWQQVTATVRVYAAKAEIQHWISPAWGTVTEESADTCIVEAGADTYDSIARWLLLTKAEQTIITPPELAHSFEHIALQSQRAATSWAPEEEPPNTKPPVKAAT